MLRPFLAALLLIAAMLPAQNTPIQGSGCTGTPFTSATDARVGQPWTWSCPVCLGTATHYTFLGVRAPSLFPIQPPLTCVNAGVCQVACLPFLAVRGPSGSLTIPPDNRLIGACLCAQCACLDINFNCWLVFGGLEVCIRP